jgi:hypothetical protein
MSGAHRNGWDHALSTALLGIRRAPVNEAMLWPHAELRLAADGDSAELKLLRATAAQYVMQVAGSRAAAERVDTPSPIEVDRSRFVTEAAAMRLIRMIKGGYPDLIDEWLQLVSRAQRQLPPHFVPTALTHVRPVRTAKYAQILGNTGPWLAQINPEWQLAAAVAEPSKDRWQSGSLEERRAELVAMRRRDADEARRWLAETWPTDPPDAREVLLSELAVGLSSTDEAFLDAALDDKRKAVRQIAVQLLARLPDSSLVRRHCTRVDALIAVEEKKGLLAKLGKPTPKLRITLPESLDKPAQRDGIELKPPAQRKIGERTYWLVQIVALVPPQHWLARFNGDADAFIAALFDTDYGHELLLALTQAVARHPQRDWLLALVAVWRSVKEPPSDPSQAIVQLLERAPEDVRQELFVMQLTTQDAVRDQQAIYSLLQAAKFDFGTSLTRLAIEYVRALVMRQPSTYQQNRNLFDPIAYRCDVPTASELLMRLVEEVPHDSNWRRALEQLNDIVEFRAAMRREIL